ncbi:glycosyltransferase family A protein [Chlorobium sp. N1]|uniref:glycosyltransferase family 2 protein n=1 Tax=Chlorobium sp. N1 TaxID=2491138 RepID=UPI0010405D1F|nr:glycosyltransferase family A protein [Chlorobium sp. N1]TCD47140.1 glycosyltransferase family 2 protein [Chlorobium sp. N1]
MRFRPEPLVSVVMATYNRAGLVAEAVESVVRQSITGWELIIVDDGSTDDTFDALSAWIERHPAIRYMKHSNRKAALSRNAGIQASFGRYVTFLDSDDRYLPLHLESRVRLMEGPDAPDMLSGGFSCPEGTMVRDRSDPGKLVDVRGCIVGGTMFARREVFLDVGGFRALDYAEDTDLWERAAAKWKSMKIETPETYLYRQSPDSITLRYQKP